MNYREGVIMDKNKYVGSVSLGGQLKKFREQEGMTQYQIAALLHLAETVPVYNESDNQDQHF